MRSPSSVLFILSAALAATMMGTLGAQTTSEDYIMGPVGDAAGVCGQNNPTGLNIARVCFPAEAGMSYRIRVEDLAGHTVGYEWSFNDADGNCVGSNPDDPASSCPNVGAGCGELVVGAPPKAAELTILLDGFAFGLLDCTLGGPGDSPGFATVGTVTVTDVE